MSDDGPSYHDVIVYVDGVAHKISDNYSYDLVCARASGWQLWWRPLDGREPRQIGGEFHGGDFRIEVRGVVVCQSPPPSEDVEPEPPVALEGGWDGRVSA